MAGASVGNALVIEAEQLDDVVHVGRGADPTAHPSGVGQNVVGLRLARVDERVARLLRKRQVGKHVAVDVAKLHTAEPELDSAEPVIVAFDPVPRPHLE